MNKKLKTTFKNLLKDKLPKTWQDFENLHPDKDWVIHTINNLLTEKIFLKQLEIRLLNEIGRQTNACKPENVPVDVFLTSVVEAESEEKIKTIMELVIRKPLFLQDPPKPKVPSKWLELAKNLLEQDDNLLRNFYKTHDVWNIEQAAISLRDLCKENEDKIQEIVEDLKKKEQEKV